MRVARTAADGIGFATSGADARRRRKRRRTKSKRKNFCGTFAWCRWTVGGAASVAVHEVTTM